MCRDALTQPESDCGADPVQLIGNANSIQDHRKRCRDDTDGDGRQSHLRLSDTSISSREEISNPIGKVASHKDTQEGADERGDKAEASLPRLEVVGGGKGGSKVGRDGNQEADGARRHESSPEYRWQGEKNDRSDEQLEEVLFCVGASEDAKARQVATSFEGGGNGLLFSFDV